MKKITLISAALFAVVSASAQRMMGVATSNWAGIQGVYLNPANIADSRCRIAVDLFSINAYEDNTLGKVNLKNAFNSSSGDNIFSYSGRDKFSMLFPALELKLPGIMVSFGKNSLALTTRGRGVNQFHNFDKTFYQIITDPPQAETSSPYNVQANNFNWTGHAWTEVRLTYAREVYNEGDHFLSAGLTVSRLNGLGYIGVKGSINSQFYPQQDSLVSDHTDIELSTTFVDSFNQLKSGVSDAVGQFFNSKTGNGWGFDIGAVYEYRPEDERSDDPSANQYKVRASVAITDIGSIKYNNTRGARIQGNGTMTAGDLSNNFGDYASFAAYANAHKYYLTDTAPSTKKVSLPTSLIVGADYHAVSHLYINGTLAMNLANRMNFGNSYYSQFTLTPRWDTKWFSAGLPVTYNTLTGMKVGVGFRVAGFFFGSDDMLVLTGANYGANFYVGGFVPIYKKHRKSHSAPNVN